MWSHEGRVALVTGAAQGIGQAFAERLARDGADVVAVDVGDCARTVSLVESHGRRALERTCDVSDHGEVQALRESLERDVGRCDILVNNAGIYPVMTFAETTWEQWRRFHATNLDSVFLMSKAFVPGMLERGFGRVVNMSSGLVNMNHTGFLAYISSKGGVVGFTRALASEVGAGGVTVNALAPSLVRTPSTERRDRPIPAGMSADEEFAAAVATQAVPRVELPEDLAAVLSFLVSDDASMITAQVIHADGGVVRV